MVSTGGGAILLEDTTIDIRAVIPHILCGGGERFDLEEGSSSSGVGDHTLLGRGAF